MNTSSRSLEARGFQRQESLGRNLRHAFHFFVFWTVDTLGIETIAFDENGVPWIRPGQYSPGPDFTKVEPVLWEPGA
jgi:hypothetical protein